MTKHLKHSVLLLLLVIMGSIVLACAPTKSNPQNASDNDKIISIEDAYNNKLLTAADLQSIAYYMGCAGDTNYTPTPKNPSTLNSQTQLKIKKLYLKDLQKKYSQATVNDVIINDYYGKYGSCIAVRLSNEIEHCDYLFEDEHNIGGVTFYNYCGAFVSIIVTSTYIPNDTTINAYRQIKKQEIQAYATAKLNDNYSEDNRAIVNSTIETCNQSIDSAKSTEEIDSIIMNIKQIIDGVEPLQSDTLKDGAYFITDTSFELYNSNRHPLQGDANPKYIWALIVGNQITISNSYITAYTITENNGIYRGSSFISSVDIWIINNVLYIRDKSTLSYKIDSAYDTSIISHTKQLAAPSEISITDGELEQVSLLWSYSSDYGYFGCGVEIKNSEHTDFTPIQIQYPWINTVVVDCLQGYLKQGENLIRLHNIGGYSITNDKTVYASLKSDYVTFRVFVTDNTASVEQI